MTGTGTARDRTGGAAPLTASAVAAMAGGRLARGAADRVVAGFSTDSRAVAPGSLFIALRGERFDAHTFVSAAIAAGAAGALVSDEASVSAAGDPLVIVVDDTLLGLQRLARAVRRDSGTTVVAVTGSAGKTTTKEVAAALLSTRFTTLRSSGNLNNHVGLPLSLLALASRPEVAVVELGMNHAGEIATLVRIAEPEVRVWTNVAPVHVGHFPSVEAIADAKAEIFEGARESDLLVANADDPLVMARAPRFNGRLATFGIEAHDATIQGTDVKVLGLDGTEVTLVTPTGPARVRVPLIGLGNLANVLAAVTVAAAFEVPIVSMVPVIEALVPVAQRGRVDRLAGGVTLVDDSYNANPSALEQVLAVVAAESRCGRKIAVLGEMLELGDESAALHALSGRVAARSGIGWLITVGGEAARAMGAAAVAAGIPSGRVWHAPTSDEAAERVAAIVRPGDLVLVKGSRGVRTERVAERIRAEFS